MRLRRAWYHMLGDEHPPCDRARPPDIGQNTDALVIIPIVQDHFEGVGVGRRNFPEHVAAEVMATVGETELRTPKLVGFRNDRGQIKDGRRELWISSKQAAGKMAMASADVAQGTDCREFESAQGCENPFCLDRRVARHRFAEQSAVSGVIAGVLPERDTELAREAVLAAVADDRDEMLPGGAILGAVVYQGHGAQRPGMVGAEQGTSHGKPESLVSVLDEQTDRREGAQETVEQDRISADRVGNTRRRSISVRCQM